MTPRENFIHFLKREPYTWTPSSLDQKRFSPDLYPDNAARGLVLQQKAFPPEQLGGKDCFGVDWVFDPQARGSMEVRPLLDDLDDLLDWEEKITFPDLNSWDWAGCKAENAEYLNTDKLLTTTIYSGLFERLISFIGFENASIALVDEDYEDAVKRLFDRLTEFYIDLIQRMHRWFNIDWVEFHDDWGTQRSLTFSKQTHDELIYPYICRIVDAAHAEGMFYEQHSCGLVEALLPSIISSGADTWRGQDTANDKDKLVDLYGDQFNFGISFLHESEVSDEDALSLLQERLSHYQGKHVWFAVFGKFTPHQTDLFCEYLHKRRN